MSGEGQYKKRRKYPRIKIDFSFTSVGSLESLSWEIGNLSKGGVFIKTNNPLRQGAEFPFKFIAGCGNNSATVQGRAKVAWNKSQGSDEDGMGIAFIEITEASMAMIEKLVNQAGN